MRDITRIDQLRQILESHGYYQHQIKDIIRDCIGRRDLVSLTEEEADSVVTCLEEYVNFAQKCKQNKK